MKIKKVNELNEGTDPRIHKISRYLSDLFYPKASKNTFPVICDGINSPAFPNDDFDLEVYFRIWDEDINDYKKSPVTTIIIPSYVIK